MGNNREMLTSKMIDERRLENIKEENGIIFFDKPVTLDFLDFSFQHLGCDVIATRESAMCPEKTTLINVATKR